MADTTSSYIIPVNLQAIRVANQDQSKFKGPSTNFQNVTEGLGWSMNNPLEKSTSSSDINVGIHLHWSLPDALTHGKQFANGEVMFPAAPDRWLVTRYYSDFNTQPGQNNPAAKGTAAPPKVAQWIVEGNLIDSEQSVRNRTNVYKLDQPSAPVDTTKEGVRLNPPGNNTNLPNLSKAKLGNWSSYDAQWSDQQINGSGDYLSKLTAIDFYGPGFSAYYQNSLSVFGFYDDFEDIIAQNTQSGNGWTNLTDQDANFSVSYQVVGWYSDGSSNDILVKTLKEAQHAYKAQPPTDGQSQLEYFYDFVAKELKWKLNESTEAATGDWPTAVESLYSGVASNVQWLIEETPNPNAPEFLPEPTKIADVFDLDVAIGNNTAEAMSTMITKEAKITPNNPVNEKISLAEENSQDGDSNDDDNNDPFPNLEAHLEFLFNAFQQGLLRKLASSEPDLRLPQLEEYLHTARFSGHKGGKIWNLRLKPEPTTDKQDTKQVEAQLPLAVAQMLSHLNDYQQKYDSQTADLRSREHQAFLDWTNLGLSDISQKNNPQEPPTCNIPSNDAKVWDYVTAELLQLYAESSNTGTLKQDVSPGGQASEISFQPIWTNLNKNTEGYCIELANAQMQLEVLLPTTLKAAMDVLQTALANLQGGDTQGGAIKILQQFEKSPNPAKIHRPIYDNINSLLQLTNPNDNATICHLNNGLNELDKNQTTYNQVLNNKADSDFPGLLDIKEVYNTQTTFKGLEAIKNFVSAWEDELFNGCNLLDGQQIYVLAEAANYHSFDVAVVSAPLMAAIAETQQRLATIKTLTTDINNSITQLNSCIDPIYNSLNTIRKNVTLAISELTADPSAVAGPIKLLQQSIDQIISDILINHTIVSTSQGLQDIWMTLMNSLPVGHGVTIMANIMGSVSDMTVQELSLVTTPAKPFYAPNDPVLLMTEHKGADVQNVLEPVNRNGRAEPLPCRTPADLISAVLLNGKTINAQALESKTKVAKVFSNIGDRMSTVQALLNEAYMILPQAAYDLLVNAAGLGASDLEALIGLQGQIIETNTKDQAYQKAPPVEKDPKYPSDPGNGQNASAVSMDFTGIMPYYIGTTWFGDFSFNPFLPLYMAWSASYSPVELGSNGSINGGVFPADYLTSNFTIGDTDPDRHVDLVCKQPLRPVTQNGNEQRQYSLSGQITLTSRASAPLLQQIKVFFLNALGLDITKPGQITYDDLKNDLQKDLYNTYQYFDTKVILSQAMSGFNEQLLQQFPQLSLPLNSNLPSQNKETGYLFEFLRPYLNNPLFDQSTVGDSTASNNFLPFRAGTMTVDQIFIVDAFGRYFQMDDVQKNIYRANSMAPPSTCPNDSFPGINDQNYLPPRILQPSRLSFNWLAAESLQGSETTFEEHTQQPAASPICGWLFPNHLDKGLTIYDAAGHALGSLNAEGAGPTTTWRNVPKSGLNGSTNTGPDNGRSDMVTALENANYVLKNFLEEFAFPATGASPYNGLLNVMRQAQSFTQIGGLQSDKGLAILIGQPLVLVRAVIRLDLQGSPTVALDSGSLCGSIKDFLKYDPNNNDPKIEPGREYNINDRFNGKFTDIDIPVMLGDLTQFNDGLVGYFINDDWQTFYSPASTESSGRVQQALFETLQLTPNYEGQAEAVKEIQLTMIVDPRAAIHATTGILPVKQLRIR